MLRRLGGLLQPIARRTAGRALSYSHHGPNYKYISSPYTASVLGVPMRAGQPRDGVQTGPSVIREGGLRKLLETDGWVVEDHGDLEFESIECSEEERKMNAKFAAMVGKANKVGICEIQGNLDSKVLADATYKHAKNGRFVLSLGGDHSLGIGSIAGILRARPETAVVWVDAHADINTPKTTSSGNIHGMSVAFLMGLHDTKKLKGFEWLQQSPDLVHNQVVYVGLRDLDPLEKVMIKQMGLKAFTMQDVDRYGIGRVMEMAIDHVCNRVERPLHFSLDIDSVDPTFAPSTGTRVYGGLTYREAYFIAESLAETGLLASMDMVEVNTSLSNEADAKATVEMAVGLVASAMGNRIL